MLELGRGDHGLAVPAQQRRSAARGGWRRARTSRRRAAAAERRPRSAASSSRSASSSASRPRRCWPREPYARSSRPSRRKREVVAVRAVAGEAALEVGVDALGQLGGQRLGVGRLRARPVAQLDLALEPEAGGVLGEARAQPLDGRVAVGHQRDAVAGQLGVPGGQRGPRGAAGADRGQQRVALRERGARTRAVCRPGPATARRRPGPGASGAAPAPRGRAPAGRAGRPRPAAVPTLRPGCSTGAPSAFRRFGSPGLKPTEMSWRPELVLARQLQPRQLGAEAHHLALVGRPARAARAGEVDRLQQVRLAGAVTAGDDRQPRPQPHVRRFVASGSRAA